MRGRPGHAGRAPPPADATFTVTTTCNAAGTSVTVTWPPQTNVGSYSYVLISPANPHVVIDGGASTTTSITLAVQPETQYKIDITAHLGVGSTLFTCDAPLPFTLSYTCDPRQTATVSWHNPPKRTDHYLVTVWDQNYVRVSQSDDNKGAGKTIGIQYDADYSVQVVPQSMANEYLHTAHITVNCPNLAPTVSAGPDQTVSVNWHIRLSGTVSDPNIDPVTYEWTCGPADLDIAIEGSTSVYAKVILPTNYAGTATCTLTATDGSLTSSDTMTITVQSSGGGSAPQDQTGQGNPPPSDVPDGTPDRTDQGGQTNQGSTRTTGGGSGGTGGGGSFFFIPSSSPSRTQSEPEPEPEPYQPVLTNGTIPFVKFRAVPLNGTYWNGTTTTPFQCDIEPTGHGHVNMTGLTYLGMAYHDIRTSNVTHANATDTTPAVYNMTVHAVSTYNMTELGSHGALFHVAANDIVWSIYPDTIPVFRDLFDDTDILAITQYGTVHWAAADGACRAP